MKTRVILSLAITLISIVPCWGQHQAAKKRLAPASAPVQEKFTTTLLRNPAITLRRFNIPPHEAAPVSASTHDYLIISIGKNAITAKNEVTSFDLDLGPGEMQVIDGGWPHSIMNRGDGEAELFMIEPMKNIAPKNVVCGLNAKTCAEHRFGETAQGSYNQYVQFETETAKLLRLSIGAGVRTHLHDDKNPHLIVALTPFVGHQDAQSFDMKAGDMRWIPGGFDELGNDGTSEVRALILELK